jgi:hypothetical protein
MNAGSYISCAGHFGLIGWVILGGVFAAEPEPVQMTDVSVISGADFDAMVAAVRAPDQVTEVAQPQAPEISPDTPDVTQQDDTVIQHPAPLQAEVPPADVPPEVTELALPPEAEVDDTAPVLDEPVGDVAVLVPEIAPQAVARPVDRVAPEPVAQPQPDATPDPVQQEAVSPDAANAPVEQENRDATAPEEATTEIVTEATSAPARSARPPGRRPAAPPVAQAARQAPQTDDIDAAAIAAAVAAAQTPAPTPAAPSGPPLSSGEKENLRVAVSSCWNVGSLSSEALQTTVTVSVAMNTDGTPIVGSITLDGSTGGSAAAARQAFEAARRAIIRCGARGFQLPAEKYGQWQNIEMTFNPERMRVK